MKSRSQIADIAGGDGKPHRAGDDQHRADDLDAKVERIGVEVIPKQHRNAVAGQHVCRHACQLAHAQLQHAEDKQNAIEGRGDELDVAPENLDRGHHGHGQTHLQRGERWILEALVPAGDKGPQQTEIDHQEEPGDLCHRRARKEVQLPAQCQDEQAQSVGRGRHAKAAQPQRLMLLGRSRGLERRGRR